MCVINSVVLMLPLFFHGVFAVKHYVRFFLTASTGIQNVPEFIGFATFDDIPSAYCDSNGRAEPQQEWARRLSQQDPQHLKTYIQECERHKYVLSGYMKDLNQQMNQTEDVHVLQRISGCGLDDETGEVVAFSKFGYDGEDFLSFDFKTSTWVAVKPEAHVIQRKLNSDVLLAETLQTFYLHTCPERLKKYLEFLKGLKINTVPPSVSLLQRTPSSPVSCHSTDFFPGKAVMFWRRDGQQVREGVQYREILPNYDHTFQMTVELNISLIKEDEWRRYECVFQLPGVKEEIVTRLDRASIRTNWVPPSEFPLGTVVAAVVAVLLVALCVTGLYLWKRRDTALSNEGH